MLRLSSNLTLLFKFFLPILYITALGAFTLYSWIGPEEQFEFVDRSSLKWGLSLVLLLGIALSVLLAWPLKRVETDDSYVYVSNYFKTARYRWDKEVVGLTVTRFLLIFPVGFLELSGKGSFGRKPFFLARPRKIKQFKASYPEYFD